MKELLNGLVIRKRRITIGIIIMTIFLLWGASYGEDLSPEATVSNYYNAVKNGDFEQSYEYGSQRMRDGRTREQWAEDWRKLFELGKVVVLEFGVSPAKIEGDKATVRLWSRTKDITNSKGILENEIDHLIKEKGVWKIDETEVLIE